MIHNRSEEGKIQSQLAPVIEQLREQVQESLQDVRAEMRALRVRKDPELLLTLDEAADVLGVSRRTVSTLIAEGSIQSLKVRRARRIRRKDLDAFIKRRAKRRGQSR
jgi:excisionase family DNA binding protein